MIGMQVCQQGYPIGYQVFEGNTSKAKTLIPVLESFQEKFGFDKLVIIADAALLSKRNIDALEAISVTSNFALRTMGVK